MHSIPNRNFEIHIFEIINILGKSGMLQSLSSSFLAWVPGEYARHLHLYWNVLLGHPLRNHYWKSRLCRGPETFGKGHQTLDNAFAESSTRQRANEKSFLGHDSLPSTRALGSRQSRCREPTVGRRPKKVDVSGGLTWRFFEILFADGLTAGPSAKRVFFIFF
jgi:hypothetical protein